jgi:hypothetical protein
MIYFSNAKRFASNSSFVTLHVAHPASGGIAPGDVLEDHHPNDQLDGQRPVDLLVSEPRASMDVARSCSIRSRMRPSHGGAAQALAPA